MGSLRVIPPTDIDALVAGKAVLLFDGVCVLCNAYAQFLLRHDTRHALTFATVQSPIGQAILAHYDWPLSDWHSNLFLDDGQVYEKFQGFCRMMAYLPAPWSWLRLLKVIPRPLGDWGYDRIARNRYEIFGMNPRCYLPTPDEKDRFL